MRAFRFLFLLSATLFSLQISAQTLNESFSATFPPEFWKVYNQDQGQFTWSKSTVRFLSGPGCARIRFDGRGITNDDWLVTRKVYPTPTDNLLRFSYRSHNVHRESLEVYASTTGNRPEDFQYLLAAFGFDNQSYVEQAISLAEFDSTPIYVAFRYNKRFSKGAYLDNISGLPYLPKDVGIKTIISPPYYVMNGENIYPQVIVKNYGSAEQENFEVNLFIADSSTGSMVYNSLQTIGNLAPQESVVVTFSELWVAREGTYQVKSFTSLEGDMDLTNDTLVKRSKVVFSEINDAAVTGIINPVGTLAPGTVIPQASVANYSTSSETFSVNFDIILHNRVVYTDTVIVTLERNGSSVIDFLPWDATTGVYQSEVRATIEEDVDSTNDVMNDIFEVLTYYRDVGTTQILAPIGEVIENSLVEPQAEVENFGDLTETFSVKFTIGEGYVDSLSVTLNSGERRTISFRDWNASELGTFITKCSTNLLEDEELFNDCIAESVMVVPGTGINENTTTSEITLFPNPFINNIRFSFKDKQERLITIYDAAGTRIRRITIKESYLWNGTDNKGSLLPKGIYFVRIENESDRLTRKIIFR